MVDVPAAVSAEWDAFVEDWIGAVRAHLLTLPEHQHEIARFSDEQPRDEHGRWTSGNSLEFIKATDKLTADRYLGKTYNEEWLNSLSQAQRDGLNAYLASPIREPNQYLRGNNAGLTAAQQTTLDDHIKNMDAALQAKPLSNDLLLFRGMQDYGPFNAKNPDKNVGKVITDPAYASTSLLFSTARGYADKTLLGGMPDNKGVIMEIHAPKGTPAAGMDNVHTGFGGIGETNHEIVLPRSEPYKIVSSTMRPDGILYVVAVMRKR